MTTEHLQIVLLSSWKTERARTFWPTSPSTGSSHLPPIFYSGSTVSLTVRGWAKTICAISFTCRLVRLWVSWTNSKRPSDFFEHILITVHSANNTNGKDENPSVLSFTETSSLFGSSVLLTKRELFGIGETFTKRNRHCPLRHLSTVIVLLMQLVSLIDVFKQCILFSQHTLAHSHYKVLRTQPSTDKHIITIGRSQKK